MVLRIKEVIIMSLSKMTLGKKKKKRYLYSKVYPTLSEK